MRWTTHKFSAHPRAPRTFELFAGAGGMALGLAQTGCAHCGLLEWDADACATSRSNWAPLGVFEGDARDFSYRRFQDEHGTIDCVAGGPPCQPFSLGGVGKGVSDTRDMFGEAARAIAELRPRYFIFENVKGLLREKFASYFGYILRQLQFPFIRKQESEQWFDHSERLRKALTLREQCGNATERYRVKRRLFNAADFGVPQNRFRVFIIGVREDLDVEPEFPETTHSEELLLWEQWVTGEYWERHCVPKVKRPRPSSRITKRVSELRRQYGLFLPQGRRWVTVRDAISDMPRPGSDFPIFNHEVRPGAKPYPGHEGSPYDEPSKALKAGVHGVPGGENMIAFPDGSYRYYTPREAARIQSFPDSYKFCGSVSETMRQIGNAAPVAVCRIIGKHLLKVPQLQEQC